METPTTIKKMLAGGESQRLEFKSSGATLETLGATICAFLNSGGGQIVVGVTDDGRFEGAVTAKQLEERLLPLSGGGANGGLLSPNAMWDLSEERAAEGSVVIIDVPGGSDVPYVFKDKIFVRAGTRTKEASGSQTRQLIEKRYLLGVRWERQPALEVTLDDLDEREIRKTVLAATDKRGWTFRDPKDLIAVLQDLKLFESGRITNAAVILFAKEAGSIFPQAQVRMTAYRTDKTGDALLEDRVAKGHLFSMLDDYEAFVKRHVAVSSDFTAAKETRTDAPEFPYWPLREGFRNALMHRDYSSYHGRVTVSLYPHRVDIWSYGELPPGLSISSLKTADRSLPVNPDIAQVVFLRGLVDLLGRGTRKIVEEFRSFGLREPTWKPQAGGITLTMHGGHSPGGRPSGLNARQVELLRAIRPGESITIATVIRNTGGALSERTSRNDLARLVSRGFFIREGQGKSTFYVRTEKPIA